MPTLFAHSYNFPPAACTLLSARSLRLQKHPNSIDTDVKNGHHDQEGTSRLLHSEFCFNRSISGCVTVLQRLWESHSRDMLSMNSLLRVKTKFQKVFK